MIVDYNLILKCADVMGHSALRYVKFKTKIISKLFIHFVSTLTWFSVSVLRNIMTYIIHPNNLSKNPSIGFLADLGGVAAGASGAAGGDFVAGTGAAVTGGAAGTGVATAGADDDVEGVRSLA